MKTTSHRSVQELILIFKYHEIKNIIICPGSRNAPLIIAFNADTYFNCYSVIDERVAGFMAIGMTQSTNKQTVVVSTSGSAVVNFFPAVVEAFYQKISIIVLSADRPLEWINQGDGQTIHQDHIFGKNVIAFHKLLQNENNKDYISWYNQRELNQAIILGIEQSGPIHINVPLSEPLYNLEENIKNKIKKIQKFIPKNLLSEEEIKKFSNDWNQYVKRIILVGTMPFNEKLNQILNQIAEQNQAIILCETTSNLYGKYFYSCIDSLIESLSSYQIKKFTPDLLITIGNTVVSKKIKSLFRTLSIKNHWHISKHQNIIIDTYQKLTNVINTDPYIFFNSIKKYIKPTEKQYGKTFFEIENKRKLQNDKIFNSLPWSDLKVFYNLEKSIPKQTIVHLANSTPVRYAQLLNWQKQIFFYSNRGTSGIDGSTSTAIGHALHSQKINILITGDISFLYDSNAFLHQNRVNNLIIFIINNQGGNIFRILPGSSKLEYLEQYFETYHQWTTKGIAQTFNLNYTNVYDENTFLKTLESIFLHKTKNIQIVEIFTPRKKNAEILKDYFKLIKLSKK